MKAVRRCRCALITACLAASLTGCMSLLLRAGDPPPSADPRDPISPPYHYFDGTRFDAICVGGPLWGALPPKGTAATVETGLVLAPLCLVDLPLSAVVDVLMLPMDYWAHGRYETAVAQRQRSGASPSQPAGLPPRATERTAPAN